jgi:hypothetical protein
MTSVNSTAISGHTSAVPKFVAGTAPTDFKFNKEAAVNLSAPEVKAGTVAVSD